MPNVGVLDEHAEALIEVAKSFEAARREFGPCRHALEIFDSGDEDAVRASWWLRRMRPGQTLMLNRQVEIVNWWECWSADTTGEPSDPLSTSIPASVRSYLGLYFGFGADREKATAASAEFKRLARCAWRCLTLPIRSRLCVYGFVDPNAQREDEKAWLLTLYAHAWLRPEMPGLRADRVLRLAPHGTFTAERQIQEASNIAVRDPAAPWINLPEYARHSVGLPGEDPHAMQRFLTKPQRCEPVDGGTTVQASPQDC